MKLFRFFLLISFILFNFSVSAFTQKTKTETAAFIDQHKVQYVKVAKTIWEHPELGYLEFKSSALLQKMLKEEGFTIQKGVAGIPTAFIASYGSESPVIGILGEFDALPGLSQEAIPEKKPVIEDGHGHGCGHHLFGTASAAAAISVKHWLIATGTKGTIRFYGCPAEEGGSGKVYMVRAGLFNDVDIVLHWHPADMNSADPWTSLANISAKFRFTGIASHAAAAPEKGRSALDGVESMDYMVNMMREHVPQETRIHYVITNGGGTAPNVVPAKAEVFYYVRFINAKDLMDIFNRVVKAGQGAALGTGTTMNYEIIHGVHTLLPNLSLSKLMDANLRRVGGVSYTEDEEQFAEKIRTTLIGARTPMKAAKANQKLTARPATVSTRPTAMPTPSRIRRRRDTRTPRSENDGSCWSSCSIWRRIRCSSSDSGMHPASSHVRTQSSTRSGGFVGAFLVRAPLLSTFLHHSEPF